ncbi:1-acyl-sn-glycerol-3-phosphate acyltransferase [Parabacteroides bouchesdurhonensis]|uniref:1-acyl-sn-glycerol-3-phosphate acyltransferase n=1 Tax=Parabacteroides bouchesdurhonensis TaxID=1936995 RepID=UPI000C85A33B|nr:1-acyl-sn-glycerol-3-phosphate acyltransferase [Parabacteroides bouchesdurhonensis]
MTQANSIKKIDIRQVLQEKAPSAASKIPDFIVNYLIRTVHQDELNDILTRYHEEQGVDFMKQLIGYFDLSFDLIGKDNIPDSGRYIFASNHPLGGLDGICLSALIGEQFKGNIRYLVNDLLLYIDNLKSIFVPVNKHGAQGKRNAMLIEEAYASDHQIITFPAGLCSRKINGQILDLEWKKSFIQKAVEYKRDIIPVYFDGKNSNFFYRLANIRKALGIKMNYEMIYLPDEMFRCKHKTFRIYFGKPIPWQTLDNSKKPAEWAEWIKRIVYNLKKQ